VISPIYLHQNIGVITAGRSRQWQGFVFPLLLVFGIWGCAASDRLYNVSSDPVPLPLYHEGTTYIYSDGNTETVQSVTPEQVVWRNHRGHFSSGSPDFTYRRTKWESRTRSGTRAFRARNDWLGDPSSPSIWPLQTGKTARHIEMGQWRDAEGSVHSYQTQWRVEVSGKERVRVKAGSFDTWKIVARRFSKGSASDQSRVREIRTWHYAPEAGHYVKVAYHYPGGRPDRSIELVAILPPPVLSNAGPQHRVQSNFQQALENNPSGVPLPWYLAEKALSGTTTPTATFRLKSGTYCRQYIQTVTRRGKNHVFYGLACRTDDGEWKIPRR
jgi:hypothetical protein